MFTVARLKPKGRYKSGDQKKEIEWQYAGKSFLQRYRDT